jgi:DHA1 family bicyclomycin/chloramphenicol resistance-like MFS transporter
MVVLALVWFFFEESNQNPDSSALEHMLVNYWRIFQNRVCREYTLVSSLHFGSIFAYVTSSPLIMMGVLKVSPANYGYTFAATAAGIMFGAFLNGKLSGWGYSGKALMRMGLSLSSLTGLGLFGCCLADEVFLATLLPLLIINTFCLGFVSPNATQAVMAPVPEMAGLASAVLSSVRMTTGGLAGMLVSFLFDGHTPLAMAECMTEFSLVSLYVFVRHTNSYIS